MKPNTFRESYKHSTDDIQLHAGQMDNLLKAIQAEELALEQALTAETAQTTAEQPATSSTQTQETVETAQATGGWTAYSPASASTSAKPRKRFWRDWSMEGKIATVALGATGALATMVVGFIVVASALLGQMGQFTHYDTAFEQVPFPTEGAVAMVIANDGYENVYEVFNQIRQREEQQRRELERQRSANNRNNRLWIFSQDDDAAGWVEEELDMGEMPAAIESEALGDMGGAAPEANLRTAPAGDPDFSDTNIQVQGVQEGDIIKTDGRYIYVLNSTALTVMKANNGNPYILSTLTFCDSGGAPVSRMTSNDNPYFKMYLEGDRLIALRSRHAGEISITDLSPQLESSRFQVFSETIVPEPSLPAPSNYYTGVDIFDISDPSSPEYLSSFDINGDLVSSRMIGDILYLVCTSSVDSRGYIDRGRPETFVPSVTHDGETNLVPPTDIRIAPDTRELRAEYTHIVAIDTKRSGRLVSQAALLGGTDDLYMSSDNLFLLSAGSVRIPVQGRSDIETVGNATTLTRVELSNGHIEIGNSRRLTGIVNNQFSLDERDGVLRILTTFTRWKEYTSRSGDRWSDSMEWEHVDWEHVDWFGDFTDTTVWTLDEQLNIIGKIDGFGIDEDLYSARFMGDIVYFVTFREIDPVYAVDLSDPANPRFLSELKIPGFSEYLHPWKDGLLFGFGRDACEITGIRGGLKLSMFDISNPKDVTREHYLILDDHLRSEASENHRAILVSAERNLIAFPTENAYLVYSYDMRRGFQLVEEVPLARTHTDTARGLFIDNIFYVFILGERSFVETFRLPSFQLQSYLRF